MNLHKLLLGILVCVTIFFLACEEKTSTETTDFSLSGSFSYKIIEGIKDEALEKEYLPQWINSDSAQEKSYAINTLPANDSFNFKNATGLDFDSTTGAISGIPTVLQTSTKYTITATGTGLYTGSLSTDISIAISSAAIGNIYYTITSIQGLRGQAIAENQLKWSEDSPKDLIATYAIDPPFADTLGLVFDTISGKISGTPKTVLESTKYTIMATPAPPYIGNPNVTVQIEITTPIIGNFSYSTIVGNVGSSIDPISPQWVSHYSAQKTRYTINTVPPTDSFNFTLATGLTLDSTMGVISGIPTVPQINTEYTITATGTNAYTGILDAKITIGITSSDIGTFSYTTDSIQGVKDSAIDSNQLKWSLDSPQDLNATYTIDPRFSDKLGLMFDPISGDIGGMPKTVLASTKYTIMAIPALPYIGSPSAIVQIEIRTPIIGSFSYRDIVGVKGFALKQESYLPEWIDDDPAQQIRYAINTTVPTDSFDFKTATGLDFDPTTGNISGTPTVLQTNTEYTITAIAIAPYTDPEPKIMATITIEVNTPITGDFSYSSVAGIKGNSISDKKPQWENRKDSMQTVRYSASDLPKGLTLDTTTGTISGTPTVPNISTEYTITAIAIAPYADPTPPITATISIEVTTPIIGSVSYSDIESTEGSSIESIKPQWLKDDPVQQVSYTINTTPPKDSFNFTLATGLDFDSATGIISGTPAVLQASTLYIITVIAIAPYTDPDPKITATLSIKVTTPITGNFSYNVIAGTKSNSLNTISPQWDNRINSSQTLVYTISPTPPSWLKFNTLGELSGTPTEAIRKVFIITAIGTGHYEGSINTRLQVAITTPISGSFSYNRTTFHALEDTTEVSSTLAWTGVSDSAQKIRYSIHPTLSEGLLFDTSSGEISGMPTAVTEVSIRSYRIEARGTNSYSGIISASNQITITITPLVSYSSVASGSTATSSPVFNGGTPNGLGYSIATTAATDFTPSTTPTLPTIVSTTGEVRVTSATTAGTYVVSISGNGYSGKDKVYFYVTTSPSTNIELKTAISTGIEHFGDTADYNYILTSGIDNMEDIFYSNNTFNGNISYWDTSSVTNMSYMFYEASAFNGTLTLWDTNSVSNMSHMFYGATAFNGDTLLWDTSSVSDMSYMFYEASNFYGDISYWDTSSVTNMEGMFYGATSFNGDISYWDTSSLKNMLGMFSVATSFNSDISLWDTSSVTNMKSTFYEASVFDGDISLWDTSSVSNMENMFRSASDFDNDISLWDTSSVSNMENMFGDATAFDIDISLWDISNITHMSWMFYNATSFMQNLDAWAPRLRSSLEKTGMFVRSGLDGNEPCWYSTADDKEC